MCFANVFDVIISHYVIKSRVSGELKQFDGYIDIQNRICYECELYKKDGYDDIAPVIIDEHRFIPDLYDILDNERCIDTANNIYRGLVYSLEEYESRWNDTCPTNELFIIFKNQPWKKLKQKDVIWF